MVGNTNKKAVQPYINATLALTGLSGDDLRVQTFRTVNGRQLFHATDCPMTWLYSYEQFRLCGFFDLA